MTVKEEETTTSSSDDSLGWRKALSDMIRASDEELLAATPKLFVFFESDISPVESMSEFLDVVGMHLAFSHFSLVIQVIAVFSADLSTQAKNKPTAASIALMVRCVL